MRGLWLVAATLLLTGTFGAAEARPLYRLLQLDGHLVKWGKATLGSGAVITYRLTDRALSFDSATNCREMTPLYAALKGSGIDTANAVAELSQAFAAWEAVANVKFEPAAPGAVADIIIGAQATPRGRAFTNVAYTNEALKPSGTARGLTSLLPGRNPSAKQRGSRVRVVSIAQSLICLNPREPWKIGFGGDTNAYDLRYTFIHEIGHSIGLDHSAATSQVMWFGYGEHFRKPREGDIAGAKRLYGPPLTR